MCQYHEDKYKFVAVRKEICIEEDAFESGKIRVMGYCPSVLNTGTAVIFINGTPYKPGDQLVENVPNMCELEMDYEFVKGQDYAPTSNVSAATAIEISGLIAKPGAWVQLTYFKKVLK
ncbi:MAG: hypothetical protein U5L45_15885 [Saprospiraceae bacterium]|nr:hypothetical protein [Saprospiraceae bacterium]